MTFIQIIEEIVLRVRPVRKVLGFVQEQGLDLRDLRRPLEGVIFWDDIWLNWTHFGSLTEDNPDFLKQIFRGCFGLHLALEAESDLTIGFFMASNPSMPTFRC